MPVLCFCPQAALKARGGVLIANKDGNGKAVGAQDLHLDMLVRMGRLRCTAEWCVCIAPSMMVCHARVIPRHFALTGLATPTPPHTRTPQ